MSKERTTIHSLEKVWLGEVDIHNACGNSACIGRTVQIPRFPITHQKAGRNTEEESVQRTPLLARIDIA